ncbi:MAG: small multi-drug export protein [Candidatus Diapherotrites archaeon]|nr:small multi-drug export protein [Candidatus Diapherotrites archaeon]
MAPDNIIYLIIITILPWIELRGGIPLGILVYGMDPLLVFAICVIANILLVIPTFIALHFVFGWLNTKKWAAKPLQKLHAKSKKYIEKYGFLGLMVLVAVPLPGTGAYSGSLVAYLLNIPKKRAFIAIALGVLIAGIIVTAASIGLLPFVKAIFGI